MNHYSAIALLEFRDISVGLHTTDALIKKAPIHVLKCGTVSQGRYLALFGGTTASVEMSYLEGIRVGKDSIIDHLFLPDVHPAVHDGILGRRDKNISGGAVGILETNTIACNVGAAERAMKATPIQLVELRLSDAWLAGKGISIYHGGLSDVEASMELAKAYLDEKKIDYMDRLITAPHEALTQQLSQGTHFVASKLLDIGGETGEPLDIEWVATSKPVSKKKKVAKKAPKKKAGSVKKKSPKKKTSKKKVAKKVSRKKASKKKRSRKKR